MATIAQGVSRYRVALLLLAAFIMSAPLSVHAGVGLSIQPVKISETIQPGATISGEILLKNVSDVPVRVEVSTKDFIPVEGADSIQFVSRAPGVTTVADWITIESSSEFQFAIGESRSIRYTITAPPDAEPGGHFGVMLFKATDLVQEGTLKVGTQVGMLVLIAIPGNQLEKGKIHDFTAPGFIQRGPVTFGIKFQNTGTVHFEPRGVIEVRNLFGQKIADVPIDGTVVLPGSIKTLSETWEVSGLFIGRYTASAIVVDGEGNELTTKELAFWAFPLWYAASFFFLLVVFFFIFRFIKKRVRISLVSK